MWKKPLARTFYEAELLMQAALKRPNLVTQVGNQGHSEANYFQFKGLDGCGYNQKCDCCDCTHE